MPLELRERLLAAATRSDRSLNAEIVHRLERSLEEDDRIAVPLIRTRARRQGSKESREGRGMNGKRLRLGVVGLAALVLVAAAAIMGGVSGSDSTGQAVSAELGEAEGPPALAAHLAKLSQALPPNGGMSLEGPGGAAGGEFAERAYPDNTISVAEMEGARDAFTAAAARSQGKGNDADWEQIGPSRALYPRSDFLTSFLYVPNTYVAGGRTTSIAVEDECGKNDCEAYITPAGGGVWHTYNLLKKNVKWNYRGGPLGINAAGAVTIDSHDPSDDTVYVGTGEANICGSGCVAGTGLYRTTEPRPHLEAARQDGVPEARASARSSMHPDDRNILYVGDDDGAPRHELRVLHRRDAAGAGHRQVGPVQVHRTRRDMELHPQRLGLDRQLHRRSHRVQQRRDLLAARREERRCSIRSNPEIVYATSYARGVWRSTDGGATWTQIKASLNPAVIQTRATIAVNTLQNGDTRMYVYEGNAGQNSSRDCSAATAWRPACQCSPT